jgi:hypothetical protein
MKPHAIAQEPICPTTCDPAIGYHYYQQIGTRYEETMDIVRDLHATQDEIARIQLINS